jgi:hypothetical protein
MAKSITGTINWVIVPFAELEDAFWREAPGRFA